MQSKSEPDPQLRKLYPELTDEELIVAEEQLTRYLELAIRVFRRISDDPHAYRQLHILTKRKNDLTITDQGSNQN